MYFRLADPLAHEHGELIKCILPQRLKQERCTTSSDALVSNSFLLLLVRHLLLEAMHLLLVASLLLLLIDRWAKLKASLALPLLLEIKPVEQRWSVQSHLYSLSLSHGYGLWPPP